MAEFVELRSEDWIQELEQLKRLELLTPDEIKRVAERRKQLEYKLQAKTKTKEDFLSYIKYEMNLITIIKARRELIGNKQKKTQIEYSISRRICKLFEQVITRFKDDIKLYMSYFKFCKSVQFFTPVSKMLTNMLQVHADKPQLWVVAADWEFDQCLNFETARDFLMKGLRHHPQSELLYKKSFELEIKLIEIKKKEKADLLAISKWNEDIVTENIIQGLLAQVIFKAAITTINKVQFAIELLSICEMYKDNKQLEHHILRFILDNYSDKEETWDKLARRKRLGLSIDPEEVECADKISTKEKISQCVDTYKRAVRSIASEKMWHFYMEFLLETAATGTMAIFRRRILRDGMEACMESGLMSSHHYLKYAEHLKKHGKVKKQIAVLKRGTQQHPTCIQLLTARLHHHTGNNQEEEVESVLKQVVQHLKQFPPKELLILWKKVLQYFESKSAKKVEELYQLGLKQDGDIKQLLKPLYLEWVVLTHGIAEGRTLFQSGMLHHPPCLEVINKMVSLESVQSFASTKHIRKCHELAVTQFGKDNFNVWLEYINFEMKLGKPVKVSQLHFRAMKELSPANADIFNEQFNLLSIKS